MIDSHCHLTDPKLHGQLDEVFSRAAAAGVKGFATIGTDLADAEAAIAVCEKYPDRVRCAIGIHPNHCQGVQLSDVDRLADLAKSPHVIAIGETGLDYHHQFAGKSRQREFFEKQLDLAVRLGKPAVLHCREAVDDALIVLAEFPAVRCVFHCFTGTLIEAERVLEAGAWIGFTGAITFKKNEALRHVVRETPLDRILVETDAPYLSPEPVRSHSPCEPAFVAHTLGVLASVKGISPEAADRITADNTQRFYGCAIGA
ncbi:MAG: TatD family hydrolase [Tepidisphaeraceae bacterium]